MITNSKTKAILYDWKVNRKHKNIDFVSRHKGLFIFSLILTSILAYAIATNYGDQFGMTVGSLTTNNISSPDGTIKVLSNLELLENNITSNGTSSLNLNGQNQFTIRNYNLSGNNINWSDLNEYPVSCPANSYATQIGDAVTCTEVNTLATPSRVGQTYYVQSGNWSDLNNTIWNDCSESGCEVRVPSGMYYQNHSIFLRSNLTLVFEQGSEFRRDPTATNLSFYNQTDIQDTTTTWIMIGEGIQNFDFYNYGFINTRIESAPAFNLGVTFFLFNNSQNINLNKGGKVEQISGLVSFHNSQHVSAYDIKADKISSGVVVTACSDNVIISKIKHTGYSTSETIDINEYGNFITISDIQTNNVGVDPQEVLDINGASYVTISNIQAINASHLLTYTNYSGERLGGCSQDGKFLTMTGATCIGCTSSIVNANAKNFSALVTDENGLLHVYGDVQNSVNQNMFVVEGDSGDSQFNGHQITFTRNGANIIEASGGTSAQLYFRTGGTENRMLINEFGGVTFGGTSLNTNHSFDFRSSQHNFTIFSLHPKDDINSQYATELRFYGDKDFNINRYAYIRELNDATVDKNSLIFGTGNGGTPLDVLKLNFDGKSNFTSSQPVTITNLTGVGNVIACIDAAGTLYRGNATGCP